MADRQQKFRRDMLNKESCFIETNMAKQKLRNSLKYKKMEEDTHERIRIQDTIEKMAKEGKGKLEILTYLMNEFPDEEKSKYYGIWIHNKFKKLKIKDECEQGR